MICNRQRRVRLDVKGLEDFALEVAEELNLGKRWFDVGLVDDAEMQKLNSAFRRKKTPTDVLSFPWARDAAPPGVSGIFQRELEGFLGDIVISAQTAARDAAEECITLNLKIRQLILHGALHLLGYDHQTDHGEMLALERESRCSLRIDSSVPSLGIQRTKRRKRVKPYPRLPARTRKGVTA